MVAVWQAEQRSRCSRCGTWQWEWVENPDAWHADHDTCEGCRRLDLHEENVVKGPGMKHGIRFGLYKTAREG